MKKIKNLNIITKSAILFLALLVPCLVILTISGVIGIVLYFGYAKFTYFLYAAIGSIITGFCFTVISILLNIIAICSKSVDEQSKNVSVKIMLISLLIVMGIVFWYIF